MKDIKEVFKKSIDRINENSKKPIDVTDPKDLIRLPIDEFKFVINNMTEEELKILGSLKIYRI